GNRIQVTFRETGGRIRSQPGPQGPAGDERSTRVGPKSARKPEGAFGPLLPSFPRGTPTFLFPPTDHVVLGRSGPYCSAKEVGAVLFGDGVVGLALLVLWIFCILDVISTEEVLCRNLPKYVWLLIVIILPDVGSIAWL